MFNSVWAGTGDVTGDTFVTSADLGAFRDHLIGKTTLTTSQQSGADINSDSKLDIADLVQMVNQLKTKITIEVTPDTGKWTLSGPSGFTAISGTGDRSGTNAIAMKLPRGAYTLHFEAVTGYRVPPDQVKTIMPGDEVTLSAVYTSIYNIEVEMLPVGSGSFIMGRTDAGDDAIIGNSNELPRHEVTMSAYHIGKYEVTVDQYCTILSWAYSRGYLNSSTGGAYDGKNIHGYGQKLVDTQGDAANAHYLSLIQFSDGGFKPTSRPGMGGVIYPSDHHPMTRVTWYGAVAFCNWLSEEEGLTPCYDLSTWTPIYPYPDGYRLPTESEWERAAAWEVNKHWIYGFKADTVSDFSRCNFVLDGDNFAFSFIAVWANPLGFDIRNYPWTSPVGWFNGWNKSPNFDVQTVDSPSPAGCYDMSGNAEEWCQDWYHPSYVGAPTNGRSWDVQDKAYPYRVSRGGGYGFRWYQCRTAWRYGASPDEWYGNGFRLARSPR